MRHLDPRIDAANVKRLARELIEAREQGAEPDPSTGLLTPARRRTTVTPTR